MYCIVYNKCDIQLCLNILAILAVVPQCHFLLFQAPYVRRSFHFKLGQPHRNPHTGSTNLNIEAHWFSWSQNIPQPIRDKVACVRPFCVLLIYYGNLHVHPNAIILARNFNCFYSLTYHFAPPWSRVDFSCNITRLEILTPSVHQMQMVQGNTARPLTFVVLHCATSIMDNILNYNGS